MNTYQYAILAASTLSLLIGYAVGSRRAYGRSVTLIKPVSDQLQKMLDERRAV